MIQNVTSYGMRFTTLFLFNVSIKSGEKYRRMCIVRIRVSTQAFSLPYEKTSGPQFNPMLNMLGQPELLTVEEERSWKGKARFDVAERYLDVCNSWPWTWPRRALHLGRTPAWNIVGVTKLSDTKQTGALSLTLLFNHQDTIQRVLCEQRLFQSWEGFHDSVLCEQEFCVLGGKHFPAVQSVPSYKLEMWDAEKPWKEDGNSNHA